EEEYFEVEMQELTDQAGDEYEAEALMRQLVQQFEQYIKVSKKVTKENLTAVSDVDETGRLTFMTASHLPIRIKDKQKVLEIDDVIERMRYLLMVIANEKKVLNLEHKIGKRVQNSMERTQKEYYLREHLKAIQKELGEGD